MSGSFNLARLDAYARREGISARDAARRFQKKSTRIQRQNIRARATEQRVRAERWDLREELG